MRKFLLVYLMKESTIMIHWIKQMRRIYEISNEALYEHRIITFVHYDYRYDINEHAGTIDSKNERYN